MGKKSMLSAIALCCEKRFNRGPAVNWKHSDFYDLQSEILRVTEVNISPNTLKRIFGKISVEDDYFPQQATLEALKKYGQFHSIESGPHGENHDVFQQALPLEERHLHEVSDANRDKSKINGFFSKYKVVFIITILVVFIYVVLILLPSKTEKKVSGKITQTGIEGILPATVFFDLQVHNGSDSLFVDFGDKTPTFNVLPGQRNTAHNYLFPGVYRVSLKTRHATLSTINVSVRSDKWIGLAYPPQGTLPYHFFEAPAIKAGSDSLFHITNSQLFEMGIDTVGLFYTQLSNFTPVTYTGEDFIFEATFKNDLPAKGISCKGTQFQISGMSGIIRFKLVNAGCSYRVINIVSEQTFDGRVKNLSQFVVDLSMWNSVRLENKNKQVALYVNGKLLFKGRYYNSLGRIHGLFLEFEGNGHVKNCELKTLDGRRIYHF